MNGNEKTLGFIKQIAEMCRQGQLAGAELELHAAYRQAGCPAVVHVLLASLLARRGRHADAAKILNRIQPASIEQADPDEIKLTISLLISLDRPDDAAELGKAYHLAYGHEADDWLRDMSVPDAQRLRGSPDQKIDELARDLAREPKAIHALVFAQRQQRDLPTVDLLRKAIRRIVPLFEHDPRQMTAICRAMAELSLLAGDQPQARRWAHRGLEEDPYCAQLALLLDRLRDDGGTALPPYSVLTCAAHHHLDYPDVQAALIRRELIEGRLQDARKRLADWLEREPYSPHALRLQEDLAA